VPEAFTRDKMRKIARDYSFDSSLNLLYRTSYMLPSGLPRKRLVVIVHMVSFTSARGHATISLLRIWTFLLVQMHWTIRLQYGWSMTFVASVWGYIHLISSTLTFETRGEGFISPPCIWFTSGLDMHIFWHFLAGKIESSHIALTEALRTCALLSDVYWSEQLADIQLRVNTKIRFGNLSSFDLFPTFSPSTPLSCSASSGESC